jgi:hypothetical protein
MDPNPYESPRTAAELSAAANRSTFGGVTASFTVQGTAPHVVEIYFSRWSGLEIYRVDGIERLRRRYFGTSGVVQIEIEDAADAGDAGKHVLEIVIRSLPWWRGYASFDGQVVVADLFPAERRIGLATYVALFLLVLVALLVIVWGVNQRGLLRSHSAGPQPTRPKRYSIMQVLARRK